MSWKRTLGRVSFVNCDPVFYSLEENWDLLPAPPAWLTGHLLRRDCLTAPIPTSDYATHSDQLHLIPDLGIVSNGHVGSVLLFGRRPLESMRDIALPSDSSTSKSLLKWILSQYSLDPRLVEMGPDMETMLGSCDGALLIGNRALSASRANRALIQLDLGAEWSKLTGLPMVFGVFAARRDTPIELLREAHDDMVRQYNLFENNPDVRSAVIDEASQITGFHRDRMATYFDKEVSNLLDEKSIVGLNHFLDEACNLKGETTWFRFD